MYQTQLNSSKQWFGEVLKCMQIEWERENQNHQQKPPTKNL